ncbi:MAG: hypothetical protein GXO75_11500 [Calditrichaeota bacterium]|nr:hypothetical protein [Calditrichota bacterium]
MEAIRIIKRPVNGEITIDLPASFTNEEVEVIVMPVQKDRNITDESEFDPEKYRGALKVDMSIEQIEQECKKMRDEWDRDF